MSHNITVEGGSSVRLPTAGKYCDRDIIITATGSATNPIIQPLEITENGTYTAPDGVDGYSPVVVSVSTAVTTEIWTLTMEDGTEITKEVVVV